MPKVRVEKVIKTTPKKVNEFNMFLEILEKGQAVHLGQIAQALGVGPETLTDWKKDPRAIEAQTKGVLAALEKMEKVGTDDWRMWQAKLAMAGIQAIQKTDITTQGDKIGGLSADQCDQLLRARANRDDPEGTSN